MKEDMAFKNPALGLIEIVKKGLFFIIKYVKSTNVLRSIIKFGFLQKFILPSVTLLGTFFLRETASLQKIRS
jgi:hypothetical protein